MSDHVYAFEDINELRTGYSYCWEEHSISGDDTSEVQAGETFIIWTEFSGNHRRSTRSP